MEKIKIGKTVKTGGLSLNLFSLFHVIGCNYLWGKAGHHSYPM